VAVSEEDGLHLYRLKESAINQEDFVEFVKDLQRVNRGIRLALFMDNLNVHKGKDAKAIY